jgi:4-oxalocrotonate tautomerase
MPIVQVDFKEGRTIEQKRELVAKITEAFTSSMGVSADNVQIIIREFQNQNYAKSGKLNIDK